MRPLLACLLFMLSRARAENGLELRVAVVYENQQPAGSLLRVRLISAGGSNIQEGLTEAEGKIVFSGLHAPVEFQIRVTGPGIDETTTPFIELSPGEQPRSESVVVHHRKENATAPTVSLSDLAVPSRAKKELDRGGQALANGKLEMARNHFSTALSFYPQYAAALNNLGIVAIRENDDRAARSYFEQALKIDEHSPDIYANLGKLSYREGRVGDAELMFEKILILQPNDVESLVTLANLDLSASKFEGAIAKAKRVHALPHEKFAVIHVIAARAFNAEKRTSEAVAELQVFLREAPGSPLADSAKRSLTRLGAKF